MMIRLEAMDGPHRSVDADIAEVLGHSISWRQTRQTMEPMPVICWAAPHPYAGMVEPCPEFTGSLDAVYSLINGTTPDLVIDTRWAADGNATLIVIHAHFANNLLWLSNTPIAGPAPIALVRCLLSAVLVRASR